MLKVLVVDDEMPIRQWLEFCIQKIEGYEVVGIASHGAEGFSMFRKTSPDIVITDIRMPVMDGLEMMKMIQNLNPSVYTIILTSHEDFTYARQAMSLGASEYILKTEISDDGLRQLLNKAAEIIGKPSSDIVEKGYEEISSRNNFLRSLVLRGQLIKISEAMLAEYGVSLKKNPYFAVNLFYTETEGEKIHRTANDFLDHAMKIPIDSRNMILLGNVNKTHTASESRIREGCSRFLIQIIADFSGVAGVSDLFYDPGCAIQAMLQAKSRAASSFYCPRKRVFNIQDEPRNKRFNGEGYKILFNKELINQNYEKALDVKSKMMEEIRETEPADIDQVRRVYLFFITSLLHMTVDDVDSVELLIEKKTDTVMKADSLDILDDIINDFFQKYSRGLCRKQEYSHAVRNAITYMEEHYADSITQTEVAEFVGLSSEYLSRIFKEETGVKFVVFLNNLRLKQAIHLLETTNLKVYEIAERVGYANLSYFSTVFKKNFGQNPFDFKNNTERKEEP